MLWGEAADGNNANAFPNFGGNSLESILTINDYMGRQTNWVGS